MKNFNIVKLRNIKIELCYNFNLHIAAKQCNLAPVTQALGTSLSLKCLFMSSAHFVLANWLAVFLWIYWWEDLRADINILCIYAYFSMSAFLNVHCLCLTYFINICVRDHGSTVKKLSFLLQNLMKVHVAVQMPIQTLEKQTWQTYLLTYRLCLKSLASLFFPVSIFQGRVADSLLESFSRKSLPEYGKAYRRKGYLNTYSNVMWY